MDPAGSRFLMAQVARGRADLLEYSPPACHQPADLHHALAWSVIATMPRNCFEVFLAVWLKRRQYRRIRAPFARGCTPSL